MRRIVEFTKLAWTTLLIATLSFSLVTAGCKKAGSGGETSKLISSEVRAKLAPDALAIVDLLTDKTQLFGFVDLGQPLAQHAMAFGWDKALVDDVTKLLASRAGLEVGRLQVAGLAKFSAKEPVFFLPGVAGKATKGDLGFTQQYKGTDVTVVNDVYLVRLGTTLALGTEQAIKDYLDQRAAGATSLAKANPAWVTHMLTHAAGQCVAVSVNVPMLAAGNQADNDADAKAIMEHLDIATMLIGKDAFRYELGAKPGHGGALLAQLNTWLDKGRSEMQTGLAELAAKPDAGAGLAAKIFGLYGNHFFDSIERNAAGDVVSVRLPWRMPQVPAFTAGPNLAQRASAPGEWMVGQVNMGMPLLEGLLAATNIIGAKPMDVAPIGAELAAFMVAHHGIDLTGVQAITASMSGETPLISVVRAATAKPLPGTLAVGQGMPLMGDAMIVPTPWGAVLGPLQQQDALVRAAGSEPGAAALASHPLLQDVADAPAFARVAVDFSLAPAAMREAMGDKVPVKAVYARLNSKSLDVEVQAQPGKAPAIQALVGLGLGAMQDQARKLYEQRETLPLPEAIGGVFAHHQAQQLATMLKPKDLGDDRLLFSIPMPAQTQQSTAIVAAAAIGVVAAVAIPAFMKYQQRAAAMQDVAPAPTAAKIAQ